MSWFIINLVVGFASGEGQLLVFPKNGKMEKGVKYVLSLKTAEEVAYWSNKLQEAKTNGASGLMVKVAFTVSDRGYVNTKAFVKNGVTVKAGDEMTYYVRLTEGIKSCHFQQLIDEMIEPL